MGKLMRDLRTCKCRRHFAGGRFNRDDRLVRAPHPIVSQEMLVPRHQRVISVPAP
jgi:hypothetical protein